MPLANLSRDRLNILEKSDPRLKWTGWKKDGANILLVVPSEKPCKYYGIDKETWTHSIISEIKKYSKREIIVREKSSRQDRVKLNTIYDALDLDIFATVTYNSIAAVESVAYGIPAFTLAPSAAQYVTISDISKIEEPFYPDVNLIEKWKRNLSYTQFSETEIKDGIAWEIINNIYKV